MNSVYIDDTAKIKNSSYTSVKIYRNVCVSDSVLGKEVSIGDDSTVERTLLGDHVIINRRSYINDSEIGSFSYSGINTTMNYTKLGKFCSLARNVDIGGFNHDYKKVTTMPYFRFAQMINGKVTSTALDENKTHCEIGNDVWIAAGAIVLHKVKIGDGAVIGAGSVVTHDVPPYAIAAGTPAKIIAYRCDKKLIDKMCEIAWWNWSDEIIMKNIERLINSDINEQTVDELLMISSEITKNQNN